MRAKVVIAAVVAIALGAATLCAPVQASIVIGFDDLPTTSSWSSGVNGLMYYGIIPLNYQGLTWTPNGDTGWNVGRDAAYMSAYRNTYSAPSSPNFAYNSGLAITSASGTPFYFNGAQFSTWAQSNGFVDYSSRTVTVMGYLGGLLVDQYTLNLLSTGYVSGDALDGLVDTVTFSNDNGSNSRYWIMDNMEIAPVPEPATFIVWSLLGAGSWLGMRVWRGKGRGRARWSPENRQAIHEIIARGAPR